MKRAYPANINGQIFYIDEDAYNLLKSYLDQLHQTFTGTEGAEIVSDIESRIREHFNERMAEGASVITIVDVNNVIETMGRPEELCDKEDVDKEGEAYGNAHPPFISFNLPAHKRLYRNMKNKVFGGVIGGLAAYLGWQPNIMRIIMVIITIMLSTVSCFWLLPVIYLIAWMIIPAAVTPAQILAMNGTPRNVDTLGQAVLASQPTPPPYREEGAGFFSTFFNILGKGIMAIFGFCAFAACFGCIVYLFCAIIGLVYDGVFNDTKIIKGLGMGYCTLTQTYFLISAMLTGVLFTGSLSYGALSVIFNLRGFSKGATITIVILCVVLFLLTAVLGILAFLGN